MDDINQLRRLCEAYIKRTVAAHTFDLANFMGHMESAFKKTGYRTMDRRKKEHILVLRLDGVRGAVMTTGFLRELRRNRPQAHISLVVNSAAYPLMEQCPYADRVYEFDPGTGTVFQDILRGAFLFCLRHLWKSHYDLCLCPQWGGDRSWTFLLAFLGGARERIGYSGEESGISSRHDPLLTRALVSPPEILHDVARAYHLIQTLGMKVEKDETELWVSQQEQMTAQRILVNFKDRQVLVAVALGADQACKKYPVEQYVSALQSLAASGVKFILLGGSDVDLEGNFFTRHMPKGSVMNLIGQTNLKVMAAILSMVDLYIGNDNSIAYMAAACSVPVIELLPEAEDKKEDRFLYSLYERAFPWKTPAIVLRPSHALPPCNETAVLGGCCATMPHCICRIPPEDLVAAYLSMEAYWEGSQT